jgi:hypothetical protein
MCFRYAKIRFYVCLRRVFLVRMRHKMRVYEFSSKKTSRDADAKVSLQREKLTDAWEMQKLNVRERKYLKFLKRVLSIWCSGTQRLPRYFNVPTAIKKNAQKKLQKKRRVVDAQFSTVRSRRLTHSWNVVLYH